MLGESFAKRVKLSENIEHNIFSLNVWRSCRIYVPCYILFGVFLMFHIIFYRRTTVI